jgi:hypothetical protein
MDVSQAVLEAVTVEGILIVEADNGSYRGGRGHGNGRSGNYSNGRPQPDEPCRMHGGSHKWRKCVYNPYHDADAPEE